MREEGVGAYLGFFLLLAFSFPFVLAFSSSDRFFFFFLALVASLSSVDAVRFLLVIRLDGGGDARVRPLQVFEVEARVSGMWREVAMGGCLYVTVPHIFRKVWKFQPEYPDSRWNSTRTEK